MADLGRHILLLMIPLFGFVMLIFGFVHWRRQRSKIQTYAKIQGAVISNEKNAYFDSETPWSPTVEYRVAKRAYTISSMTQHRWPVKKGAKMTVIYDPDSPSNAYIFSEYYAVPLISTMIGFGFMLLGSVFCRELWNASN